MDAKSSTRRRTILAAALLVLLSSCLEFEGQEIRWAYDAAKDRLDVQLVYRGFYVSEQAQLIGPPKPGFESADEMLGRVLGGEPIVALGQSFPFAFCFAEIEKEGLEPGPDGKPKDPLALELVHHVAVEHGDFFRAADGRLCAWQHVRVTKLAELLTIADALVRRGLTDDKQRQEFRDWLGIGDEACVTRLDAALANGVRWCDHHGGALEFHVPATEAAATAFVERWAQAIRASEASTSQDKSAAPSDFEEVAVGGNRAGIHVATEAAGLVFTLGDPALALQRLLYEPHLDEPHHDLTPLLEKRKVTIRTDVTDETLSARFAEFCRS